MLANRFYYYLLSHNKLLRFSLHCLHIYWHETKTLDRCLTISRSRTDNNFWMLWTKWTQNYLLCCPCSSILRHDRDSYRYICVCTLCMLYGCMAYTVYAATALEIFDVDAGREFATQFIFATIWIQSSIGSL